LNIYLFNLVINHYSITNTYTGLLNSLLFVELLYLSCFMRLRSIHSV